MNRDACEPAVAVDETSSVGARARAAEGVVRVVHVGDAPGAPSLGSVLGDLGWEIETARDVAQASLAIRRVPVSVVVIDARSGVSKPGELAQFVELAVRRQIAAIVIGDGPALAAVGGSPLITRIPGNTTLDEVRGRLAMVERYHVLIRSMERELARMQQLTDRLHDHFHEIDDEMKLAGRLQRDFLPDLNEPIQGVRFGSIYRPATWVSGDMFDVFRIDEHHTGVYLADAVGHGMAAGLLTMFIKRIIMPKRIHAHGYEVVSPSTVLAMLNDALAGQELPNCQFVTGCYGVIDHRAGTFTFARGGHPYPLLVALDGAASQLTVPGSLIGLFAGAEFPQRTVQLEPGDKVVLLTDGIEHALPNVECNDERFQQRLVEFLAPALRGTLSEALTSLDRQLCGAADPSVLQDDLTILAFEMPPSGRRGC